MAPYWAPDGWLSINVLDFTRHAAAYWECNTEPVNPSYIHMHRVGNGTETKSYIVPRGLPTVLKDPVFAEGKVVTFLPYCVASRPLVQDDNPLRPLAVFCDNERIGILVCIEWPSRGS